MTTNPRIRTTGLSKEMLVKPIEIYSETISVIRYPCMPGFLLWTRSGPSVLLPQCGEASLKAHRMLPSCRDWGQRRPAGAVRLIIGDSAQILAV